MRAVIIALTSFHRGEEQTKRCNDIIQCPAHSKGTVNGGDGGLRSDALEAETKVGILVQGLSEGKLSGEACKEGSQGSRAGQGKKLSTDMVPAEVRPQPDPMGTSRVWTAPLSWSCLEAGGPGVCVLY